MSIFLCFTKLKEVRRNPNGIRSYFLNSILFYQINAQKCKSSEAECAEEQKNNRAKNNQVQKNKSAKARKDNNLKGGGRLFMQRFMLRHVNIF